MPDQAAGKPPYRVPAMAEIADIPANGLTVASFFAGAGGSSLGYRMAGYRVLYANEFVPIAQESYRANAARTMLDGRDVRKVKAAEVLKACRLKAGELDVLDGSPPCQAFSTAGRRAKGWGKERAYEHGATQLNEDLFFEFVRLRDGIRPRTFVAENVSGLVKGVAKGYFLEILRELQRGYRVEARLLDAQWLGVPQTRQRIVFVGVREDLQLEPAFPDPLPTATASATRCHGWRPEPGSRARSASTAMRRSVPRRQRRPSPPAGRCTSSTPGRSGPATPFRRTSPHR